MKRSIIDSHCHVHFPQYDADREEVIQRAQDAGVRMITIGTNKASTRDAVRIAEAYEGVWATIGVHPEDEEVADSEFAWMEELAKHPRVVAVGEVGFDYSRREDEDIRIRQRAVLVKQLAIAKRNNLPAVLHCRNSKEQLLNAYKDALEVLDACGVRGVFHSFTGSSEQASACMAAGHFIGLNAIVTFSNGYASMVRSLPSDRILMETDAPYLAPAPYRGQRNEPLFIYKTVDKVAELSGRSVADIERITSENALELFNRMKD